MDFASDSTPAGKTGHVHPFLARYLVTGRRLSQIVREKIILKKERL
jgi:hypothetical protein